MSSRSVKSIFLVIFVLNLSIDLSALSPQTSVNESLLNTMNSQSNQLHFFPNIEEKGSNQEEGGICVDEREGANSLALSTDDFPNQKRVKEFRKPKKDPVNILFVFQMVYLVVNILFVVGGVLMGIGFSIIEALMHAIHKPVPAPVETSNTQNSTVSLMDESSLKSEKSIGFKSFLRKQEKSISTDLMPENSLLPLTSRKVKKTEAQQILSSQSKQSRPTKEELEALENIPMDLLIKNPTPVYSTAELLGKYLDGTINLGTFRLEFLNKTAPQKSQILSEALSDYLTLVDQPTYNRLVSLLQDESIEGALYSAVHRGTLTREAHFVYQSLRWKQEDRIQALINQNNLSDTPVDLSTWSWSLPGYELLTQRPTDNQIIQGEGEETENIQWLDDTWVHPTETEQTSIRTHVDSLLATAQITRETWESQGLLSQYEALYGSYATYWNELSAIVDSELTNPNDSAVIAALWTNEPGGTETQGLAIAVPKIGGGYLVHFIPNFNNIYPPPSDGLEVQPIHLWNNVEGHVARTLTQRLLDLKQLSAVTVQMQSFEGGLSPYNESDFSSALAEAGFIADNVRLLPSHFEEGQSAQSELAEGLKENTIYQISRFEISVAEAKMAVFGLIDQVGSQEFIEPIAEIEQHLQTYRNAIPMEGEVRNIWVYKRIIEGLQADVQKLKDSLRVVRGENVKFWNTPGLNQILKGEVNSNIELLEGEIAEVQTLYPDQPNWYQDQILKEQITHMATEQGYEIDKTDTLEQMLFKIGDDVSYEGVRLRRSMINAVLSQKIDLKHYVEVLDSFTDTDHRLGVNTTNLLGGELMKDEYVLRMEKTAFYLYGRKETFLTLQRLARKVPVVEIENLTDEDNPIVLTINEVTPDWELDSGIPNYTTQETADGQYVLHTQESNAPNILNLPEKFAFIKDENEVTHPLSPVYSDYTVLGHRVESEQALSPTGASDLTATNKWYQQTFDSTILNQSLYDNLVSHLDNPENKASLKANKFNTEEVLTQLLHESVEGSEGLVESMQYLKVDRLLGNMTTTVDFVNALSEVQENHPELYSSVLGIDQVNATRTELNKLYEDISIKLANHEQIVSDSTKQEEFVSNLKKIGGFDEKSLGADFAVRYIMGDIQGAKEGWAEVLTDPSISDLEKINIGSLINASEKVSLLYTSDMRTRFFATSMFRVLKDHWSLGNYLDPSGTSPLLESFKETYDIYLNYLSSKTGEVTDLDEKKQIELIDIALMVNFFKKNEGGKRAVALFFATLADDYAQAGVNAYLESFKVDGETFIGERSLAVAIELKRLGVLSSEEFEHFVVGYIYETEDYTGFIEGVKNGQIDIQTAKNVIETYKDYFNTKMYNLMSLMLQRVSEDPGGSENKYLIQVLDESSTTIESYLEQAPDTRNQKVIFQKLVDEKYVTVSSGTEAEVHTLSHPDVMSFEESFEDRTLSLGETYFKEGSTLYQTQGVLEGDPLWKINIHFKDKNAFLSLVSVEMEKADYIDPVYILAKREWNKQMRTSHKGDSLDQVVQDYNEAIQTKLGSQSSKYTLTRNTDFTETKLSQVTFVDDASSQQTEAIETDIESTVNIKIADVGTSQFIEGMKEESGGELNAVLNRSNQATNTIMESLDPHASLSQEARALVFEVVFNELQVAEVVPAATVNQDSYRVFFRFSPEDIVYSVLPDSDLNRIRSWYTGISDGETVILDALTAHLTTEVANNLRQNPMVTERLESVFDRTIQVRLKEGAGHQLEISGRYSRTEDGTIVRHSLFEGGALREPLGTYENRYYGGVKIRDEHSTFNSLVNYPESWLNGSVSREALAHLYGANNLSADSSYVKASIQFLGLTDQVLKSWKTEASQVSNETLLHLVDYSLQRLAQSIPSDAVTGSSQAEKQSYKLLLKEAYQDLENQLKALNIDKKIELEGISARLKEAFDYNPAVEDIFTPFPLLAQWEEGSLTVDNLVSSFEGLDVNDKVAVLNELLTQADSDTVIEAREALSDEIGWAYENQLLSKEAQTNLEIILEKTREEEATNQVIDADHTFVNLVLDRLQEDMLVHVSDSPYGYLHDGELVNTNNTYENYLWTLHQEEDSSLYGQSDPDTLVSSHLTTVVTHVDAWHSVSSGNEAINYQHFKEIAQQGYVTNEKGEKISTYIDICYTDEMHPTLEGATIYAYDRGATEGRIVALVTAPQQASNPHYQGQEKSMILRVSKDLRDRLGAEKITIKAQTAGIETASRELYFREEASDTSIFAVAQSSDISNQTALKNMIQEGYQTASQETNSLHALNVDISDSNPNDDSNVQLDTATENELSALNALADPTEGLGDLTEGELRDKLSLVRSIEERVEQVSIKIAGQNPEMMRSLNTSTDSAYVVSEEQIIMSEAFYQFIGSYEEETGQDTSQTMRTWRIDRFGLQRVINQLIEKTSDEASAQTVSGFLKKQVSIEQSRVDDLVIDVIDSKRETHPKMIEELGRLQSQDAQMIDRLTDGDFVYMKNSTNWKRVIVQLEDDKYVSQSVRNLASGLELRGQKVWVVRWNGEEFVNESGEGVFIDDNTRMYIVGHGDSTQIAGFSPRSLVEALQSGGIVLDSDTIGRVSFVGCNLGSVDSRGDYLSNGFALDFYQELEQIDVVPTEVSVRNGFVIVDKYGKKWTGEFVGDGYMKLKRHDVSAKVVVTKNESGDYVVQEKASSKDEVFVITKKNNGILQANGQEIEGEIAYFQDGSQVNEEGEEMHPWDEGFLTEDQVNDVKENQGENFTGQILVDDETFSHLTDKEKELPDWLNSTEVTDSKKDTGSGDSLIKENSVTEFATQALEWNRRADAVQESIEKLIQNTEGLTEDWMPNFNSLVDNKDGTYTLTFINIKSPEETMAVTTDDEEIADFVSFLENEVGKIQKSYNLNKDGSIEAKPDATDAESVDGLNGAFAVQYIIQYLRQKQGIALSDSASHSLVLAVQVHSYVIMAQLAHGIVFDSIKVIKLVKEVAVTEASEIVTGSVATFLKGVGFVAGEGLGVVFGLANVALDAYQISQATTQVEKAVYGTQLAFDSLGVIISTAAIIAAVAGATVAATALGGVGVIIAGVGIGVAALVSNYETNITEIKAIASVFQQIENAYITPFTYDSDKNMLKPSAGAVIDMIDTRTVYSLEGHEKIGGIQFDPQTVQNMYKTHNNLPVATSTNKSFNMLARWYGQKTYVDNVYEVENLGNAETIILPATPNSYYKGDYGFSRDPGISLRVNDLYDAARTLQDKSTFWFEVTNLGAEFALSSMAQKINVTNTDIYLGDSVVLAVPDLPDSYVRKTTYNIHGNGKTYTIFPNDGVQSITLRSDNDKKSTWIIATDSLDSETLSLHWTYFNVGKVSFSVPQGMSQNDIFLKDKSGHLWKIMLEGSKTKKLVGYNVSKLNHSTLTQAQTFMKNQYNQHNLETNFVFVQNFPPQTGDRISQVVYDPQVDAFFYNKDWSETTLKNITYLGNNGNQTSPRGFFIEEKSGLLRSVRNYSADPHGSGQTFTGDLSEHKYALPLGNRKFKLMSAEYEKDQGAFYMGSRYQAAKGYSDKNIDMILRMDTSQSKLELVSLSLDPEIAEVLEELFSSGTDVTIADFENQLGRYVQVQSETLPYTGSDKIEYSFADWLFVHSPDNTKYFWYNASQQKFISFNGTAFKKVTPNSDVPADLSFIHKTTTTGDLDGTDVFYFYSKSQKKLYVQEGNDLIDNLIDTGNYFKVYSGFENVYLLENGVVGVDSQGRYMTVYASDGSLAYTGYTDSWLKSHKSTVLKSVRDNASKTQQNGAVQSISGLTVAQKVEGQTQYQAMGLWYDATFDKFIISHISQDAKAVIYLGLTEDGKALLYDAKLKKLYTQELVDEKILTSILSSATQEGDKLSITTTQLNQIKAVNELLSEGISSLKQTHSGWLVETTDHLIYSVGGAEGPQLIGATPYWYETHLTDKNYGLSEFLQKNSSIQTGNHIVLFGLKPNPQNEVIRTPTAWYIVGLDYTVDKSSFPYQTEGLMYIGKEYNQSEVYFMDTNVGTLYKVSYDSETKSTTKVMAQGTYGFIDIFEDQGATDLLPEKVLLMKGTSGVDTIIPPLMSEVQTVLLAGEQGSDTYTISKEVWDYYEEIIINNSVKKATTDVDDLFLESTINTNNIKAGRSGDDLVLVDSDRGTELVFTGVLKEGAVYEDINISYLNGKQILLSNIVTQVKKATKEDKTAQIYVFEVGSSGGGDTGGEDPVLSASSSNIKIIPETINRSLLSIGWFFVVLGGVGLILGVIYKLIKRRKNRLTSSLSELPEVDSNSIRLRDIYSSNQEDRADIVVESSFVESSQSRLEGDLVESSQDEGIDVLAYTSEPIRRGLNRKTVKKKKESELETISIQSETGSQVPLLKEDRPSEAQIMLDFVDNIIEHFDEVRSVMRRDRYSSDVLMAS